MLEFTHNVIYLIISVELFVRHFFYVFFYYPLILNGQRCHSLSGIGVIIVDAVEIFVRELFESYCGIFRISVLVSCAGRMEPLGELDIVLFFEAFGLHSTSGAEGRGNLRAPELRADIRRHDTTVIPCVPRGYA